MIIKKIVLFYDISSMANGCWFAIVNKVFNHVCCDQKMLRPTPPSMSNHLAFENLVAKLGDTIRQLLLQAHHLKTCLDR